MFGFDNIKVGALSLLSGVHCFIQHRIHAFPLFPSSLHTFILQPFAFLLSFFECCSGVYSHALAPTPLLLSCTFSTSQQHLYTRHARLHSASLHCSSTVKQPSQPTYRIVEWTGQPCIWRFIKALNIHFCSCNHAKKKNVGTISLP